MPVMSGFEAAFEIEAMRPNMLFILVSASVDDSGQQLK